MLHTIYASQAEEVTKRLDRIAKKAEKYNVSFSYTVSEEHPQDVTVYGFDHITSTTYVVATYTVAAVDVEINCDDFIRANGWTVCAKIEHGSEGNIVTPFGGSAVEDSWYSAPARCDHCGTNRARSVTFMCRNADGEIRQVGRSCLKEYTGISPNTAVMWADVRNLLDSQEMDCDVETFAARGAIKMFDVETVLALAVDSIKDHGYIKSDCPNSTRSQIQDGIKKAKPSAEAAAKAQAIKAWLVHLMDDGDVVLGPERDCMALAKSGWAKMHHFGRLAYMPLAYDRYMERKAAEEKKAAAAAAARASSDYVGGVGQRITIQTADAKLVTSWDTQFGTTYLYKFTDAAGNVFVWYASRSIELKDGMMLVGTVKDHTTYDGIKQTVLTRCKVA